MIPLMRRIRQAQQILEQARNVVALTGAGISTPSGIPDFRSAGSGVWEKADPMNVATIYAFRKRPQLFYDWVRPLAQTILDAAPNAAHYALAQLESHGPLRALITQNIDNLHFRAGSRIVHEVHGHLREMTCLQCQRVKTAEAMLRTFVVDGVVPRCASCGGPLKPRVVLFGESLPPQVYYRSQNAAEKCDVMLVAGSSLEVAPAGDLPLLAKQAGARLIIVNYEATALDHLADVVIHADVVDVLPELAAPFIEKSRG